MGARSVFCARLVAVVLVAASAGLAAAARAQCIDEGVYAELDARRRYRGVEDRVFKKAGRHEVSILGGVLGADLLSSTYLLRGAYAFHLTEELGLEVDVSYARTRSRLLEVLEEERGARVLRQGAPRYGYEAHVLWSIAYGKLRWFGATIGRFDFVLALGGGITDESTARGLTLSGGIGMRLYAADWLALRWDLRDHVLEEELLGESVLAHNLSALAGLSLFIPFGS